MPSAPGWKESVCGGSDTRRTSLDWVGIRLPGTQPESGDQAGEHERAPADQSANSKPAPGPMVTKEPRSPGETGEGGVAMNSEKANMYLHGSVGG